METKSFKVLVYRNSYDYLQPSIYYRSNYTESSFNHLTAWPREKKKKPRMFDETYGNATRNNTLIRVSCSLEQFSAQVTVAKSTIESIANKQNRMHCKKKKKN